MGYSENIEQWESNIFKSIKDVSDIKMQKQAWTGKDPNVVSSFTEVIGMLYDTFAFEEYIDFYMKTYGEDELYIMLNKLNELLSSYSSIGYKKEMEKRGG
jgi:hypothetical protein